MSDSEINLAIAEACGWKPPTKLSESWWVGCNDREIRCEYCGCHFCDCTTDPPDYCADLNAMREAEKTLNAEPHEACAYYGHLANVTHGQECFLKDYNWPAAAYLMASATARQRAEAFLRTLSKWPETQTGKEAK